MKRNIGLLLAATFVLGGLCTFAIVRLSGRVNNETKNQGVVSSVYARQYAPANIKSTYLQRLLEMEVIETTKEVQSNKRFTNTARLSHPKFPKVGAPRFPQVQLPMPRKPALR